MDGFGEAVVFFDALAMSAPTFRILPHMYKRTAVTITWGVSGTQDALKVLSHINGIGATEIETGGFAQFLALDGELVLTRLISNASFSFFGCNEVKSIQANRWQIKTTSDVRNYE